MKEKETEMDIEKEQEKLHSRNFKKFGLDMNIFVSIVTTVLVLAFITFTVSKPEVSSNFFSKINIFLNVNFNWFFVITINAALMFLIFLGFSKYGNIKLGDILPNLNFLI